MVSIKPHNIPIDMPCIYVYIVPPTKYPIIPPITPKHE